MKRFAFALYAAALMLVCAAVSSAPAQFQPGGGKGGKKGGTPAFPPTLHYLNQKAVADDLKLSENQSKQVTENAVKWRADVTAAINAKDDLQKKLLDLADASEKDLTTLLNETQQKRLMQIKRRQPFNRRDSLAFTQAAMVTELKLTDAQNAEIKAITAARRKALVPLFLTGEPSEEIAKKVDGYTQGTYALLHKVLNPDQQSQLKELLGEPVKGFVSAPRPGFPGKKVIPPQGFAQPRAYLSITGVLFADNKILHEELKLSKAQVKRLIELRDQSLARTQKIGPTFGDNAEREKQRAEQAKDNAKALAGILDAKQIARLHQVVLQFYVNRPAPKFGVGIGPFYARFVEVIEGLKLSKDQQAKIQQGTEFAKVLDAKQQATWTKMLGEPFAKLRLGGPGVQGAIGNTQLQYLQQKSVQAELNLLEAQIKKLPELEKTWQELSKDLGRLTGSTFQEAIANRNKKLAEANAALQKALAGVLDAKQIARLEQIDLQQLQKRGPRIFLADARMQKGLALSEDQAKKIVDITGDMSRTMNLAINEFMTANQPGGIGGGGMRISDEYTQVAAAVSKTADKRVDAVLTGQQRETLRTMLGAPFKGELILPKGGFGGFGGGGFFLDNLVRCVKRARAERTAVFNQNVRPREYA